jgi:hypothetical protein
MLAPMETADEKTRKKAHQELRRIIGVGWGSVKPFAPRQIAWNDVPDGSAIY